MVPVDVDRSWGTSSLGTDLDDGVDRLGAFSAHQVGGAANNGDTEVRKGPGKMSDGREAKTCRVEAQDGVSHGGAGPPARQAEPAK